MFENFTDRARKVMQLANQEAQRFNHEYIGTEHVLLGLTREGGGVAAHVLRSLHVDLVQITSQTKQWIQAGPDKLNLAALTLPQTPRVKRVLESAMQEAQALNHKHVGTEHILLGLLTEQDGFAAQLLMKFGLKLDDVRVEILKVLGPVHRNSRAASADADSNPYAPSLTAPSPSTSNAASQNRHYWFWICIILLFIVGVALGLRILVVT